MIAPASAPLEPRTIAEAVDAVRGHPRLLPIGAGTKPGLAVPPPGHTALTLRSLTGIGEYDPSEYTFTALAGTPLREIESNLARHGQYLPFDPPFSEAGATLGGTIAAGLSGPGRQRYGGVRDFILGVRFITGKGELAYGGGKVVKNAAGFDLPKLFVGSLGRLGVIVEATFKVFPRPRAMATLRVRFPDFARALEALVRLGSAPFDLEALELEPAALPSEGALTLRLGGAPEALAERLVRLEQFTGGTAERFEGEAEAALWRGQRLPATDIPGTLLVKVPITPKRIQEFERQVGRAGSARRYSASGSVAWILWPGTAAELHAVLVSQALAGLVVSGPTDRPILGATRGDNFRARIKSALDPEGRFPDFNP